MLENKNISHQYTRVIIFLAIFGDLVIYALSKNQKIAIMVGNLISEVFHEYRY